MDIILVNSVNFNSTNNIPQMGLISLHEILIKKYEVKIVDIDYLVYKGEFKYSNNIDEDIENIVDYLLQLNGMVYSFYTISNSYPITLLIAQKIKEKNENIKIAFGGPQATLTAEESIKLFDFIDVIGMGEGELYIENLMNVLMNDKNIEEIEGVAFKKGNEVVITERPRLLSAKELTENSFLNFRGKNLYSEENKVVTIEAGRGCPCSCTFCSTSLFWSNYFRLRDIDTLVYEIEELNRRYGTKHVDLLHDHFTVNKKHLDEFSNKLIEKDLPVTWGCSSRIDNLSYDSIDLLKKSKCRSIFVGIETGSPRMQKLINKNINLDKSLKKIAYIASLGIDITVSFIFGFPEETIEDFRLTLRYMEELYKRGIEKIQLHKFMPLPMTKEMFKVKDIMYFDKNDIDLSIYNEGIMSDTIYGMIEDYPDVFSQFYTFDSEVRKQYRRVDLFVNVFTSVIRFSNNSLIYLIENYGLDKIYNMFKYDIEKAYVEMNSNTIEEFFSYEKIPDIFKGLAKNIIQKIQEEKSYDNYFMNISTFESLLLHGEYKEDVIYEFDYDVIKIKKGDFENVDYPCYLRFEKKEDNKVKVIRVKMEGKIPVLN